MSRIIKFRAWDEDRKIMVTDFSENPQIYQHEYDYTFYCGGYMDNSDWHEPILMQYTGLKDRKGIEIYEGDILSVCNGSINGSPWMDKPYAVEYILNKGYNICLFCWDKNGNSMMDSTHYCEVIGNIYQNPELLNKK